MNKIEFSKKLVKLFSDKTGCSIQHEGCPCNSCFHSIESNFQHICWLVVLALRGDYDKEQILKDIELELEK